jgi:hypothetical protein
LVRTLAFGPVRIDGEDFLCAVSEKPEELLSEVLAVCSLTPDETRDVLESVLMALACLHDHKYLHGGFGVDAIVAADGCAKLTTRTIRRFSPADPDDRAAFVREIRAIGDCMVRMLSEPGERKPAQPLRPEFAMILNTISRADEKWSPNAGDLVHALLGATMERQDQASIPAEDVPVPPASEPPALHRAAAPVRRNSGQPALIATLAAVALIAIAIYFGWPERQSGAAAGPPSPPEHRDTARVPIHPPEAAQPLATRAETQVRGRKAGEWAVVAAIYNNRPAASRRAEQLAQLWQGANLQVLPPQDGARRYLVVLGSGLSKQEATQLRNRAASHGMPRDSYVTRLSW